MTEKGLKANFGLAPPSAFGAPGFHLPRSNGVHAAILHLPTVKMP
jgi:hypothetical protein